MTRYLLTTVLLAGLIISSLVLARQAKYFHLLGNQEGFAEGFAIPRRVAIVVGRQGLIAECSPVIQLPANGGRPTSAFSEPEMLNKSRITVSILTMKADQAWRGFGDVRTRRGFQVAFNASVY